MVEQFTQQQLRKLSVPQRQQIMAQRVQKEKQRVAYEQKLSEYNAQKAKTDEYNRAVYLLNRKAQGKKIVLAYEPRGVKEIYHSLVTTKEGRALLSQGSEIKEGMVAGGFTSPKEYAQVSNFMEKYAYAPQRAEDKVNAREELARVQELKESSKVYNEFIRKYNQALETYNDRFQVQNALTNVPSELYETYNEPLKEYTEDLNIRKGSEAVTSAFITKKEENVDKEGFTLTFPSFEWQDKLTNKLQEFRAKEVRPFFSGFFGGIKEQPLKTALFTAGAFVAPEIIYQAKNIPGVSAFLTTNLAPMTKAIFPGISSWSTGEVISLGLGGLYGSSVIGRVYRSDTRAKTLGEIGSTELLPMTVGGMAGTYFFPRFKQWAYSLERTKIPTEQIIPEDVISGKKKFVENPTGRINAKEYKNLFETESQIYVKKLQGYTGKGEFISTQEVQTLPVNVPGVSYHSTPSQWWTSGSSITVTQSGSSEFAGLYGAYRPSPHFLKTGGSSYSLYGNIANPYNLPASLAIEPTKFVIGSTASPGQTFIPAIKPEVESIFPLGTSAVSTSGSLFYQWNGRNIPLDFYRALPSGTTSSNSILISDLISAYSSASSSSTSSAPSLLPSFIPSSSKSSYKPFSYFETIPYSSIKSKSSSSNYLGSSYVPMRYSPPSVPSSPSYNIPSGSGSARISIPGKSFSSSPRSPPAMIKVSSSGSMNVKNRNIEKMLYDIFARRKGKDILIGKAGTLGKASSILKGKLKSTLGASGFVSLGGKRRMLIRRDLL